MWLTSFQLDKPGQCINNGQAKPGNEADSAELLNFGYVRNKTVKETKK